MSMITATTWVPRGYAAQFPTKYEFDEDEFQRIADLAKLQLDDAQEGLEAARLADEHAGDLDDEDEDDGDESSEESDDQSDQSEDGDDNENDDTTKSTTKDTPSKPEGMEVDAEAEGESSSAEDIVKKYNLDDYDDDNTGVADGMAMTMFGRSLAYYESNDQDPYITLPEKDGAAGGDDDDDEEREDMQILATDNLLLAAKVEEEMAQLEVYVYEDDADNMYVHHDIMLPAVPLCLEWLDYPVQKKDARPDAPANFVAVGTIDPDIEIWDLDVVDGMYPNAILGQGSLDANANGPSALLSGGPAMTKKKKKKSQAAKANAEYHVDAVLSLAANRQHRTLLASASADKTVKLWDLSTTQCAQSYAYHTDKVCALAWHPRESTVLLSGSYDRTVVAGDMRAPAATVPRWGVESDVEAVHWDVHDEYRFFVSTENGMLHAFDTRQAPATPEATRAVWTLQAHDESLSSFAVNPRVPGFVATASTDKTVKLWNIQPDGGGPTMVVSRNWDVGKVFSVGFAPDADVAFRLSVAGSKGTMHVWDTSTNAAVRRAFADRAPAGVATATPGTEDRVIGVQSADDDDDSDDEI